MFKSAHYDYIVARLVACTIGYQPNAHLHMRFARKSNKKCFSCWYAYTHTHKHTGRTIPIEIHKTVSIASTFKLLVAANKTEFRATSR